MKTNAIPGSGMQGENRGRLRSFLTFMFGGKGGLYAILALLGSLIAFNEYEAKVLDSKRRIAHEQYAMTVNNLGSSSLVVRVGALGQLPALLRQDVPARGDKQAPLEGLFYLLGLHEHRSVYPYHDDLIRVIRALLAVPKVQNDGNGLESEAFLSTLCEIGAEGWYNAQGQNDKLREEECLSWIWSDAPADRLFDIPSYSMFREGFLRHVDFSRMTLKRAEFSQATIIGGDFSDCTLTRSHFRHAIIRDVNFSNADLRHSDFSGAKLTNVNFSGASLQYASFSGSEFSGVDGGGVAFSQSNLAGVDFRGADIRSANLEYAKNLKLVLGLVDAPEK